tara:strand:- start:375 stop:1721 length:1347 start_codon:yes stop_codon:yes gene_type:complete
MATYLGKTFSSAGNQRTWTWSGWVKFTGGGSDETIFSGGTGSGASGNRVVFQTLSGEEEKVMVFSGNTSPFAFKTSASLRDKSAWYHFVLAMDTTQATDSNRFKMYINGSQVTNTAQLTYPAQNLDLGLNNNQQQYIGLKTIDNNNPFNGYLADVYFIDGTQLTATSFGETDSTTGIWKPKTYSGSYGSNGYKLEFKNAGALGTDTSGNSNTWTVSNAGTGAQVIDTPTNNFCTMNPLANKYPNSTFTLGNLAVAMGASQSTFNAGTFGVSSGKWYFEMKPTAMGSGTDNCLVGVVSRSDSTGTSDYLGEPTSVIYRNNGNYKKDSGNATYGASWSTSDIVMVAVDCDNNNIYFGTNGQWADGSGNNDEASPNSAIAFTSTMIADGVVFPAFGDLSTNSPEPAGQFNFGNPPFSISSGNADANGYGNFEYAVPSGYYALCTENLNTYG